MQACDSLDFTQHNKYTSLTTPTPTPAHTNTRNPSPKHPGPLTTPGQIIPTLPAKGTRGKQTEAPLSATLGNTVRPNYLIPQRENPSPLGPCTPPSDSPLSALEAISPGAVLSLGLAKEVGKTEDGVGKRGTGELMRPEVRHHLVDIHGLAVFLRRSTRCLSCREAFCLYVTGKISAHLAAVTQVKITCQKCNYTTSQTLSKPSGVSDDHHSPQPPPPAPAPTPAPAVATPGAPQDTTIPPPPPYPNPPPYPQKPRHQTVIKLLKEENLSPSEALLKGKDVPSIALKSMPSLHPLRPIERVWIKEEGKGEVPDPTQSKEAIGRVEKVEEEVKEEVVEEGTVGLDATFDPLSTDWCQWSGVPISSTSSSSSSSVLPRLHLIPNSSSGGGQLRTTITTTTSTTIDTPTTSSSPPTISLPSPEEAPETKKNSSGILHRILKGKKKVEGHPKGPSMSTSATLSATNTSNHPSILPTTDGMYRNPASSAFTVFSATQTPYGVPIASNLLQSTPAAPTIPSEPSQQLRQALEIKQKLERDLEASLQLVRRMIQVSPEFIAWKSTQDQKGTRSTKGVQDGAVSSYPQLGTTSQEELLVKGSDSGSLGPSTSGDSGGSSKRKREKRYKNKGTQMGSLETKGAKGKASRSRKRDAGGRGGGGDEDKRDGRSKGAGAGEERRNARVKGGNTEENEGSKRKRRKTSKTSISQESEGPFASPEVLQPTQGCQERVEGALFDMLKPSLTSGGSGSGGDSKKEQEGKVQSGGGDGRTEEGGNQSSSTHPPSCRCCSVPDSSNSPPPTVTTSSLLPAGAAGGAGEEQGGVASQSEIPHHPNSSCLKCCNIPHSSHSSLPTPVPSSSSPAAIPCLRDGLETWDHAQRLLGDYASRKRLRKATIEGPSGVSHNLISALQQAFPPSPPPPPPQADATRDLTPSVIPDSVLDHLQRNLTHLVQKNSLKLALRSLVRRRASRSAFSSSRSSSRARKYVKISVGVDEEEEEEEETKEGLLRRIAEGGGGSGQEEGKSAAWRFHDLLSSDSDSDPEDGRLVIDTGH